MKKLTTSRSLLVLLAIAIVSVVPLNFLFTRQSNEYAAAILLQQKGAIIVNRWLGPRLFQEIGLEFPRFLRVTQVDFDGNQFDDQDIRQCAVFLQLDSLGIASDRVGANGISGLEQLQHLSNLVLHGGKVNKQMIVAIKCLNHLRELGIDHAEITDDALDSLESLPNLSELYLSNMNLSTVNLESLSRCHTVRLVDFKNSTLPSNIVQFLRTMRSLESINVYGTNLSDSDINTLRAEFPKLEFER